MKILIAVDLSPATERIIDAAEVVAKAMQAEVTVLHVADAEPDFVGYDAGPDTVRDQVAREYREEHQAVQMYAEKLRSAGVSAKGLLIQGPVIEKTLQEAERLAADMLIVGSHGRGAVFDLVVGSFSRGLLKRSKLPVLVIPVRRGGSGQD